MENYDTELKICKVICAQGHSVCQSCVSQLSKCPECRENVLPNGGIVNRLVMSMLDRNTSQKHQQQQSSNTQSSNNPGPTTGSSTVADAPTTTVPIRCSSHHIMESCFETLPTDVSVIGSIACDRCQSKHLETISRPYWHCVTCKYDLCFDCVEYARQHTSPRCQKANHPMVRMDWKRPTYYRSSGSVTCDLCRTSDLQRGEYWHCELCKDFDLCMSCAATTSTAGTTTGTTVTSSSNHTNRPLQCKMNHTMQQFYRRKPSAYEHHVKCDICSAVPLEDDSLPYWHCDACKFDICGACTTAIQSQNPPFCHRDHSLIRLESKVPRYYRGRVNCDVCGEINLQTDEYWHCYQCGYDMCKNCKSLACLSFGNHK